MTASGGKGYDRGMTAKAKLTPKQAAFCREYIIDLNATRAAIRAGYSEKTARAIACTMFTKVDIQERIAKLSAKACEKSEINAEYVLNGIKAIADNDKARDNDKLKAFELIGKHLALFTDKIDHTSGGEKIEPTIITFRGGKRNASS